MTSQPLPLTLDEIAETVIGRIKFAFYDVGLVPKELQRRAEWVVNDLPRWGVIDGSEDPCNEPR